MSKVIKVLGTGCTKCQKMTNIIKEVISENNINASVEKVEDMLEIMKYNVIKTSALVVDDKIMIKGRVPSKEEVLKLLTE